VAEQKLVKKREGKGYGKEVQGIGISEGKNRGKKRCIVKLEIQRTEPPKGKKRREERRGGKKEKEREEVIKKRRKAKEKRSLRAKKGPEFDSCKT